jgi:hypothetical protein
VSKRKDSCYNCGRSPHWIKSKNPNAPAVKREAGSGRGLGFVAISKGQALVTDPKHWRDRAEEARLLAHDMKDTQSREAMLRIAKDYDYLAERAAQRARDRASSK